jgi:exodeoxyribonuclease V alpha subunit
MAKTENPPLPTQDLTGVVERLTFQNEENGYTVAKLVPDGKNREVTIIGSLAGVQIGETVRLQGYWTTHSKFGRQFEVHNYTVQLPATIEGLRKYLGSGLVKGVGPVMARSIVDHFGMETLDVIEQQPHRLREVSGIGNTRTYRITQAWEEQKHIKEIMIFLQSNGVSTGLAVKIYQQYGDEAIAIVRRDPYRLAKDIFGVGFITADKIARQIGLDPNSPQRIQAGLLYTLSKLSDEGHCFSSMQELISSAGKLLEVSADTCRGQIKALIQGEELIDDEDAVYLPPFYYAEVGSANKLKRIRSSQSDRLKVFQTLDWNEAYADMDHRGEIQLTDLQKSAVRMTLTEKVSILTGGPGTGKSTITHSIINLLKSLGGSVLLAAPTGRAAKRLSEMTGLEAKTIHRLLEYSPSEKGLFKRNEDNPLNCDLLIIDETSMVDILLMNRLLSAVAPATHLLLVGDVDQLPSVGPGNVLRDMISSDVLPVTRLETIFRQSEDSFIIVNAHRVNEGEMPIFFKESTDFFLFPEEDAEKAADRVLDLVTERIQRKFGYNPQIDIQVLSPMHRGSAGVGELNRRLQTALNPVTPDKEYFQHGARTFRQGDRVMQIRNNYEKLVYNGDMGRITRIDNENQIVQVDYEGHIVTYEFSQLDELVHAYAVSVHKSQGSEYPVVVLPLLTQHYMMLQRNLLYTGITRAKKLVVLVGSKKAIAMAVRNNKIARRNTRLIERIQA